MAAPLWYCNRCGTANAAATLVCPCRRAPEPLRPAPPRGPSGAVVLTSRVVVFAMTVAILLWIVTSVIPPGGRMHVPVGLIWVACAWGLDTLVRLAYED